MIRIVAGLFTLLAFAGAGATSAQAQPSNTRSDVDKHTRAYIRQVRGCMAIAGLSIQVAAKQNDFQASATIKQAADTCDAIRSRLASMNTDHFDKQATTAWGGVDRIKSGLNAMVKYIDTGYPSKLNEAIGKIRLGTSWCKIGVRGINARRQFYGLPKI